MKNRFTLSSILLLTILFFASSCEIEPDQEVLPVLGVYDGHIIGLAGPFSMSIAASGGDDITIDALFDGIDYFVIEADTDCDNEDYIDIDINSQFIDDVSEIYGDGFYFDGTIQLDYSIRVRDMVYNYQLIASKY